MTTLKKGHGLVLLSLIWVSPAPLGAEIIYLEDNRALTGGASHLFFFNFEAQNLSDSYSFTPSSPFSNFIESGSVGYTNGGKSSGEHSSSLFPGGGSGQLGIVTSDFVGAEDSGNGQAANVFDIVFEVSAGAQLDFSGSWVNPFYDFSSPLEIVISEDPAGASTELFNVRDSLIPGESGDFSTLIDLEVGKVYRIEATLRNNIDLANSGLNFAFSIPEPSTGIMSLLSCCLLLRRRRG